MRRVYLLVSAVTLGAGSIGAEAAAAALRDPLAGVHVAQSAQPLPVPEAPAGGDSGSGAGGQAPAAPDAAPSEGTGNAAPAEPPAAGEDAQTPDQNQNATGDDNAPPEDLSLGEIPIIETMELSPDVARKALDVYLLVKDKYQNSQLDEFENLQDFVDQTDDGKAFDADVKAAGFSDVNAWNLAITTLTFAYSNAIDDQTSEIQKQIAEIEQDTELAQDMKDRMISSLKATIPSDNNKKVVAEMMADPAYGEKLKQLDLEEE